MKYKKDSQARTGLLFAAERHALLGAAHSSDVYGVLSVRGQACDGEVVSGGGQLLLFGSTPEGHLISDPVAGDPALRRQPVHGEGGGEDLGEAQAHRRVQS